MMELRINPVVAEDLKMIKTFIAEDNADKILETVEEIYRQFENIRACVREVVNSEIIYV